MNPVVIIFPAFGLFVLVAWAVGTYNKFIKYRNRIEEAWSGIDVALKRRANIIPSLVRVIKAYGAHESEIFQEKTRVLEEVQRARNRYNAFISRYNILVESFPAYFIASKFGFRKRDYLALELATQREMPEVKFNEGK